MSGRCRCRLLLPWLLVSLALAGCQPADATPTPGGLRVLAVESFLADLTQQVAGDRLAVDTLVPPGTDPHVFEPTPRDVARLAESQVLVINGAGLEGWLEATLQAAGGERRVIEASAGLPSRTSADPEHAGEPDPHFWTDPVLVKRYVENIRDGLSAADPAGSDVYVRNAEAYLAVLDELDAWIGAEVARVPPERRLLVTNHESLGYFADRYGFEVVGTLVPSPSSGAAPSAEQLSQLVADIRATGAPAIFLETGTNPAVAEQVAREAGVRVETGLLTHSTAAPGEAEAGYLAMQRYNVSRIVEALLP